MPVLLHRNHTTPNSSLHKLRKHSTKSSEDHFHHPVTHDFALAASRAATRLCTSSPLGCPVHLHLARYVVLHSTTSHVITIRPPCASSLGCTHHRPSAASRVTISWTCLYLYTPSTGTAKLLIWSNLISHSVASLPPSSITRGLRAAVGHVTLRGYAHLVNLLITSRYSSDHTCSVRRRSISEARPLG